MTKRIALYPGTFDPMTLGHLDILKRASSLCDKLVVAVAINRNKNPLFSLDERVEMIENVVSPFRERIEVEVKPFEGLLIHYTEQVGATMIVRGLRAVSDFEYEFQLANMNRAMSPDLESVFLTPKAKFSFLSSTLVREIASMGGEISSFVDPIIEKALKERFK